MSSANPRIAAASDASLAPTMSSTKIFMAIASALIPISLFRGLAPFTIFIAVAWNWSFEAAVFFDISANFGMIASVLTICVYKRMKMHRIAVGMCMISILSIFLSDVTPTHGLYGLMVCIRIVFGWSVAMLCYGILLGVSEFGNDHDRQAGLPIVVAEIMWAVSSSSLTIIGIILGVWNTRIVFVIFGATQIPFILSLYYTIPHVYFEDYSEEDEGLNAHNNICLDYLGILYEIQSVFLASPRSFLLHASIALSSFCLQLYLTGIGAYYAYVYKMNAYTVGQALSAFFFGGTLGLAVTRGWSHCLGSLGVMTIGGTFMLIAFTLHAIFGRQDVLVSASLTFLLGTGYQMIYSKAILLSVDYRPRNGIDMICVATLLVTYNIGVLIGEAVAPVLWSKGQWEHVSLVLAVCAGIANVLFVMLGWIERSYVNHVALDDAKNGNEDDDEEYLLDDPEEW